MSKLNKCICVILVIALCMTTTVYASEGKESRSSRFFMSYSAFLSKKSDTTFEAWFDVVGMSVMEEIGASTIRIQKSADGSNWTTIVTYRKETSTYLTDRNTAGHAACVSYIGTPGFYYRAVIVLYAKDSSGFGELTVYTSMLRL